jgi:hypothetical protein
MFKKLISVLSLGLLLSTQVSAQYFTMTPSNDTIIVNTTGQGTYNSSEGTFSNTLDPEFHINNISDKSLIFKWQLMSDSTEHPNGWVVTGICDNFICRAPYSPFYYHEEQTSFPIAPGETNLNKTLFEARIYAPVGSGNGIGVIRCKLRAFYESDAAFANPLQTRNVVFLIKKNVSTGIGSISADDERIALYPNPATNNIRIVTDKTLNAQNIAIININGAQAMKETIAKDKENTDMNISGLAAGTYMVQINDAYGKLITTRKFVKK